MENEIWYYYSGFSKVYTNSIEMRNHLLRLKGIILCNQYFNPRGWDFVFPIEKVKMVNKLIKSGQEVKK